MVSGKIVSRAIRRGELPKGVSPQAVLELGSAPLYFRSLALGETVGRKEIAYIATWVASLDLKRIPKFSAYREY